MTTSSSMPMTNDGLFRPRDNRIQHPSSLSIDYLNHTLVRQPWKPRVASHRRQRYSGSAVRFAIQMCMQIAVVLATWSLADAGEIEDPAKVAQVSRQEARWAGPGGGDILSDPSSTWFVISGDVRNADSKPLAYVKLVYELVDDSGTTLASEHGYNHRAEDLRLPAYEAGTIRRADLHIPPLQPGESDSFRMMFIRIEVPRFSSWRVRVLEVGRD